MAQEQLRNLKHMRATIEFKVVSVSENTNAFGLRGYVLVARDGTAFEVGRSDCPGPRWVKGQTVMAFRNDAGLDWALLGIEIPHEMSRCPASVLSEVWGNETQKPGRLIDAVRPGDCVTIINPHGSRITGRATMRSSAGGWVLNAGGRHGTPALADESNTINVKPAKRG